MRLRLSQFDFNYTLLPGFDTHKLKGLVASLLVLKPEDHSKSTMLEIAAGRKLYKMRNTLHLVKCNPCSCSLATQMKWPKQSHLSLAIC